MAQWIKANCIKSDNLSSIPGTHNGVRTDFQKFSYLSHTYTIHICVIAYIQKTHTHKHTHKLTLYTDYNNKVF